MQKKMVLQYFTGNQTKKPLLQHLLVLQSWYNVTSNANDSCVVHQDKFLALQKLLTYLAFQLVA